MRLKKQATFRSIFRSRLTTAVLVCLVFGAGWIVFAELAHQRKLSHESQSLEKSIEDAREKNEDLQHLLNIVASPEYLEREAKSKLNLKREGERVFALNTNTDVNTNVNRGGSSTERPKNWFDFLGFGEK